MSDNNEGYYPIPPVFKAARCRSCGADITWVQTASGARMPLDLHQTKEIDGKVCALTHFATCPQGKGWSKK